jgi:hypothetical protein
MPRIEGKQLRFSDDLNLNSKKITNLAAPTAANDAARKADVDAAIVGLNWKSPVAVRSYLGNRTVAQINALTPAGGDSYVVTDSGTLTTGSLAVVAGDLVEYSGTAWLKIVSGSGGFVAANTRVVVGDGTLFSPLTDGTDETKVATFSGSSNTPTLYSPVDGDALLVVGEASYYENNGFVFDDNGAGTDLWVQFTGAAAIVAGAGLTQSGNTIDFATGDNSLTVSPNSVIVKRDGSGAVGLTASGIKVNVDDSTVEIATNAVQVKDLGITTAKINANAVTAAKLGDICDENKGIDQDGNNELFIKVDATQSLIDFNGSGELKLDTTSLAGNGIQDNTTNISVKPRNNSIGVTSAGVYAAEPIKDKSNLTALATTTDNDKATATTLTKTPALDSGVSIFVNGVKVYVTENNSGEAYIGAGDTATARQFNDIVSGDTIRWNGSVAGYQLATTDKIDVVYNSLLQ